MKPKALIFDFDGTLADSYEAIAASVNHVRASHGLAPLSTAEVRPHVGHGPQYLIEHTVGPESINQDLALYRAHHPSVLREGTRLLPGVADTLASLHQAKFNLAVCSNKPRPFTEILLDYLKIAPLFAAVVGPEDAPRIKPSPDMLLLAVERLGLPPTQALYVGDMVVDIQTARQAGVPVWVVPTGSDEPAALAAGKPDRLLNAFADLVDLLTPVP